VEEKAGYINYINLRSCNGISSPKEHMFKEQKEIKINLRGIQISEVRKRVSKGD
jgi:hypothetical protein